MSATVEAPVQTPADEPPVRPGLRFLFAHPAHLLALGFGSGLSPRAPGTAGTLWGWAGFVLLDPWLDDAQWALLFALALPLAAWASMVTARHLKRPDPGAIVIDEILAFGLVLWLVMPAGLLMQALAFALFRLLDAAKPGPVGWADRLIAHQPGAPIGWRQGFGILFDDLVAAGCVLVILALWRWSP